MNECINLFEWSNIELSSIKIYNQLKSNKTKFKLQN